MVASKCIRTWQWTDEFGNHFALPQDTLVSPGDVAYHSSVVVPDGTPAGTEFDVTFPQVREAITHLRLTNDTGQELNTAWNGNWAPHLPPGGYFCFAFPVAPAAGQIVAWRFMLTQTQVGDGRIHYEVCGA